VDFRDALLVDLPALPRPLGEREDGVGFFAFELDDERVLVVVATGITTLTATTSASRPSLAQTRNISHLAQQGSDPIGFEVSSAS
jgi:hypothetical protein